MSLLLSFTTSDGSVQVFLSHSFLSGIQSLGWLSFSLFIFLIHSKSVLPNNVVYFYAACLFFSNYITEALHLFIKRLQRNLRHELLFPTSLLLMRLRLSVRSSFVLSGLELLWSVFFKRQ